MRIRGLLCASLLVVALVSAGCAPLTAGDEARPTPRPTVEITQYTPPPETPPVELTAEEVALATQIREAAIDEVNRWSDREILGWSRMICEQLDLGLTVSDVRLGLQQTPRVTDEMVAAFVEPSVLALCPEYAGQLDDDVA